MEWGSAVVVFYGGEQFRSDPVYLSEVAAPGGGVEWGPPVVAFYGGEEFSGEAGYLMEVAVTGGVVEWGFTVVVFYGGEQCSGDTGNVFQGAVCGGLVQSGGAVVVVNDEAGKVLRRLLFVRHGLVPGCVYRSWVRGLARCPLQYFKNTVFVVRYAKAAFVVRVLRFIGTCVVSALLYLELSFV